MSVSNQIRITQIPVEIDFINNQEADADNRRSTVSSIDVEPRQSAVDSDFDPTTIVVYNALVGSHGSGVTNTVKINYKSITVPKNILSSSPLVITDFWENVATNPLNFVVHQRQDGHNEIIYDLFWCAIASGTTEHDLTIITLEEPPGEFIPVVSISPATIRASTVVERHHNNKIVYDVFVVS